MMATGYLWSADITLAIGLIWLAHIGFDRLIGYGLKYETGFRHTHLGVLFRNEKGTA